MILTKEGKVVPAGPGVSGSLIVAEGGQITEERARHFGLMPPASEMPKQKPMQAPIIVRGPEGTVHLGGSRGRELKVEPTQPPSAEGGEGTGEQKPWAAAQAAEAANQQSSTTAATDEGGKALGLGE